MKTLKIIIFLVAFLYAPFIFGDGEFDWLKEHIIVNNTENVKCDANGIPQTINTTKRSSITLSQTVSEQKQRNKNGKLVVVSRTRTTSTTDTNRHKTTITENEFATDTGFKIMSITKTEKTPTGTISTLQSRNKNGELVATRKTTISKNNDGVTTRTIETLNKDGNFVIIEATTNY